MTISVAYNILKEFQMTVERITFAIVGILIMATILAYLGTMIDYFLYAALFVGFMVFQASLTGFCPVPAILKAFGFKTGNVF